MQGYGNFQVVEYWSEDNFDYNQSFETIAEATWFFNLCVERSANHNDYFVEIVDNNTGKVISKFAKAAA